MARTARFLPTASTWPYELGLMLVVGVFFTAIGVYQSDQAPLGLRSIYWCSIMVIGGLVLMGAELAWQKLASGIWRDAWRSFLPVSVLATTPQMGVVLFFEMTLFHVEGTIYDLVDLWIAVGIVVVAMVALLRLLRVQLAVHRDNAVPASAETMPRLIADKLSPPRRSATLIALQAEDHYVRVHTSTGSELVLMRFGDALTAASTIDGFRLHRSWWAAREALLSAQFGRGTGTAELAGGLTAPISRSYAATLREAGILPA